MLAATPAKLKSGEWGARVQGQVDVGDSITITTKSGKSWIATVTKVVWSGNGVSLVATESRSPINQNHGYGSGSRKSCVTGGNCSSFGNGNSCGGYDCDGY